MKFFTLLLLSTFLVACGGGSGTTNVPTSPNTIFDISALPYKLNYNVTGSDNMGNKYFGTYRTSVASVMLDGVLTSMVTESLNLKTTEGILIYSNADTFFDTADGSLIYSEVNSSTENIWCYPIYYYVPVSSVRVDDFGQGAVLTCNNNNGDYIELAGTWRVESAGNNTAYFITTTTRKTNYVIDLVTEISIHISNDNIVLGGKLTQNQPLTGTILTLTTK